MRRQDREIKDQERILQILDWCEVMRLGMVEEQVPYVVPVNFGYEVMDGRVILYFHGANQGRKAGILSGSPQVCFEMDHEIRIEKAELACQWTSRYESIIGYGTASRLVTLPEQTRALDRIMEKYGFAGKPEYPEGMLNSMAVWKIEVQEITGKSNS